MKISVACPSYKRPDGMLTLRYLPAIRVYVDEGEEDAYKKRNPKAVIIPCRSGIQGNVSRIRNHILREELKTNDAVCLMDDDLKGIFYWEDREEREMPTEMFPNFLEKYTRLAQEWGAFMWGVNLNQDKQVYREYTPFSTLSVVLGPFSVFLKGHGCEYDERITLKEDYDMCLQQLNKHRIVLRVNKFFYKAKQSEQKGGCAAYRNMDREKDQLRLLQKKWGSMIVKRDRNTRSHNLKAEKDGVLDYNPIIKVPIPGV